MAVPAKHPEGKPEKRKRGRPFKPGCAPGPGRPSKYTEELAEEICERLAAGESLVGICEDAHMPAETSVRRWHIADTDGFASRYAHARELQAMRWADEIMAIADAEPHLDDKGKQDTQHQRLKFDARRWMLSKVLPKVYGDKLQIGGDPTGVPIQVSADDRASRVRSLLATADHRRQRITVDVGDGGNGNGKTHAESNDNGNGHQQDGDG